MAYQLCPTASRKLPAGTFALHVAGVFVDGRPAHIHSHPLRCPSSSHNGSTWIRLSAVHTPGKDSQRQLSLAESVEDLPHPSCRSGVDTHTTAPVRRKIVVANTPASFRYYLRKTCEHCLLGGQTSSVLLQTPCAKDTYV